MADETKSKSASVSQENMPVTLTYQLIIKNTHENDQAATQNTDGASNGGSDEKKDDSYYQVDPYDDVQLTRGLNGVPAKLTFKVPKDDTLDFKEGNVLQFSVNGTTVFQGFVFIKDRDKDGGIKVTAYDQLRYLKNKDCYVYHDLTATQLLTNICADYGLKTGELDNTQYVIANRIEDNKTLIDMINYALDQTLIYTEKHALYHLYDDAGKIMLKHMDSMELDVYIDAESMQDYSYQTSIDKDTYDVVKVVREAPGEQGKALVNTGLVTDADHMKEWGRLQYLMKPDSKTVNAMERAKHIMTLKNRKTREIKLKKVIGDVRVRGGSLVFISMDFGDVKISNYMMVENVMHTFSEGLHTMDLDLLYVDKPAKYEVTLDNDAAVLQKIQEAEAAKKMSSRGGAAAGSGTSSGADANQVQAGFNAADGRVSPYGSVGCVDTVCFAGSYYNPDLAEEYNKGVADTGTLCSDLEAKGYTVEPYDGTANAGDILLYGDRDHAVIADGNGGCFGNSSSAGYAKAYGDVNYAFDNGSAPTEIIHVGG